MEWISIQDARPDRDGLLYVKNDRLDGQCYVAFYQGKIDLFRYFDPPKNEGPPLNITHFCYLPFPIPPSS